MFKVNRWQGRHMVSELLPHRADCGHITNRKTVNTDASITILRLLDPRPGSSSRVARAWALGSVTDGKVRTRNCGVVVLISQANALNVRSARFSAVCGAVDSCVQSSKECAFRSGSDAVLYLADPGNRQSTRRAHARQPGKLITCVRRFTATMRSRRATRNTRWRIACKRR